MKNAKNFRFALLTLISCFLFCLSLFPQEAKELPPPRFVKDATPELKIQAVSSIASVTIYPDRATIVRETNIKPVLGPQSVVFSGLPTTLIPNSLRASGRGVAAVKILGLEVANEFLETALLPEIKRLEAEIDALNFDITKTKNAIEVLSTQEKFLNSIQATTTTKASEQVAQGKPDILSWEKVYDFLGTKLLAVKQAQLEHQKKLDDQNVKLDALKKKLDSIRPRRSQEARKVSVLIEASQVGDFKLSLAYTVMNARWVPLYTVRALPDSSEIELTVTGLIQQRSGENWENVKAQLSTASPAIESRPGELDSWTLDIYVPRPVQRMAAKSKDERIEGGVVGGVLGGVVGSVASRPVEAREAEFATAAILESGIHLNFEIKRSVDIPSDGAPHKVPIDSQKLKVKFDYVAVPKLKEAMFLRGSVKNTLAYPFLPGSADLFIIQDFVGTTQIPYVAANEEAKLYFGEDGQIKIKYEQVKKEKINPGFLGKTEKLHLVYKITVQNLRKNAAEIELMDQLPISQNDKIEIKDINIQPAQSKKDDKGILTWKLTLAPQEKKEITIDFTIEYPKDVTIIGI
ncbi:MAG: mucoidy inhibitor MuiA family protein [Candidatus Aminicenantes bacterium]|nr:mucoidy inhibitor MuiA family protein [Candidatus Aminicenantes bacterium]